MVCLYVHQKSPCSRKCCVYKTLQGDKTTLENEKIVFMNNNSELDNGIVISLRSGTAAYITLNCSYITKKTVYKTILNKSCQMTVPSTINNENIVGTLAIDASALKQYESSN